MNAKHKNGIALAIVLVIITIFLIIGTAMLVAAGANARQAGMLHSVNVHFYAGESYLHQSVYDIRHDMESYMRSSLDNVAAYVLAQMGWGSSVMLAPGGGSISAQMATQFNNATTLQNNIITRLTNDIKAAFDHAYTFDQPDLIDYELVIGNIYIPTPVAMHSGTSLSIVFPGDSHFSLLAQSAGINSSVDVHFNLGFDYHAQLGGSGGGSVGVPDLPNTTFVPIEPDNTDRNLCVRQCYPGYTCIRLEHLENPAQYISANGTYILAEDITLDANFEPIPSFSGTLQGNGRTINGMTIVGNAPFRGMFGTLDHGAVIENLILNNTTIAGNSSAHFRGALAGRINGSAGAGGEGVVLRNIVVHNADIRGGAQIGGLVGNIWIGGTSNISDIYISDSYVQGTGQGSGSSADTTGAVWYQNVGGLVGAIVAGYANGTVNIERIFVNADISGGRGSGVYQTHTGGLVGLVRFGNVNITDVRLRGTVEGRSRVGGVFGALNNSGATTRSGPVVRNVYSEMDVFHHGNRDSTWSDYFGGFVGHLGWGHPALNPSGATTAAVIERSAAYGNVYAPNASRTGGFAGTLQYRARITDAYSAGNVTAAGHGTGGFLGNTWIASDTIVERTYSRGFVNHGNVTPERSGGFVGWIQGSSYPSFIGGNFVSQTSLAGGSGVSPSRRIGRIGDGITGTAQNTAADNAADTQNRITWRQVPTNDTPQNESLYWSGAFVGPATANAAPTTQWSFGGNPWHIIENETPPYFLPFAPWPPPGLGTSYNISVNSTGMALVELRNMREVTLG